MPIIVMAGGEGTRFGNISKHTHKSLLPIHGEPILVKLLDGLMDDWDEEVVIGVKPEFAYQIASIYNYLEDATNIDIIDLRTDSPIVTYLTCFYKSEIKEPFYLTVSDGFIDPNCLVEKPDRNTFYTKKITEPHKYNVPNVVNGKITAFNHFGNNIFAYNDHLDVTGLTGLFFIKDFELWNKICSDSRRIKIERARTNWCFDEFCKQTDVYEQIIDWHEFNTLEDWINWKQ